MPEKENPYEYRCISVKKEHEVAMVDSLCRSIQMFSAVSETDYLISNRV